jgi:peptidoglycan/LPS O-acetylase OafA/YrhL
MDEASSSGARFIGWYIARDTHGTIKMNTSETRTTRILYFDSIRGLAALAVVWGHIAFAFGADAISPLLNNPMFIFFDGYAAVSMFFVLSGYVLSASHLSQERIQNFDLLGYYAKRYCRIAIPFWAALALSYLVWKMLYGPQVDNDPMLSKWALRHWSSERIDLPLTEYFKTVLMVLPKTRFPFLPQAWTLRIEIVMSLMLPFMILIACRSSFWLIISTFVLTKFLGMNIYFSLFVLGVLLATHGPSLVRLVSTHPLLTPSLWLVGFLLYTYKQAPVFITVSMTPAEMRLATGLGSAILLLATMSSPIAQKILEARAFRFLGKVSYSLYLVHIIVILGVVPILIGWWNGLGVTGTSSFWLAFFTTTVLSIALASLCFRWVEAPAMNLGYYLAARIKRPR